MHIFRRPAELQTFLRAARTNRHSVGFVPTMGALHRGHLALIEAAQQRDSTVVCSIFVNPTQFNNPKDLERYPRTTDKDLEALARVGSTAAFLPEVADIYPQGSDYRLDLDFEGLDRRLEGLHRPGHFAGVAQVVHRLLELVEPDRLYLGQKDYQQTLIVRSMIRQLRLPVAVLTVPTVREADGLALSSRNLLLTKEARRAAPLLFQTLARMRDRLKAGESVSDTRNWAWEQLQSPPLDPEYLEIVDSQTLQPIPTLREDPTAVICAAVWAESVRLIDNLAV